MIKSLISFVIIFTISLTTYAQDSTKIQYKQKVYFTNAFGLGVLKDTFAVNQLKKNTVKTFHTEFMFGNLQKSPLHLKAGVNFSMYAIQGTKGYNTDYVLKSRTITFQTEFGLRMFLEHLNMYKNPLFLELSWIHGVNNNKFLHYNNEYNGVSFGLGIVKPVTNYHCSIYAGLEYQVNRQNSLSVKRNGFMDLDVFQIQIGITL